MLFGDTLRQMWRAAHVYGDSNLAIAVRALFTNVTLYVLYVSFGRHPTRDEYLSKATETLTRGEGGLSEDDHAKVMKAYKEFTRGMPYAFQSNTEESRVSGRVRQARVR